MTPRAKSKPVMDAPPYRGRPLATREHLMEKRSLFVLLTDTPTYIERHWTLFNQTDRWERVPGTDWWEQVIK